MRLRNCVLMMMIMMTTKIPSSVQMYSTNYKRTNVSMTLMLRVAELASIYSTWQISYRPITIAVAHCACARIHY